MLHLQYYLVATVIHIQSLRSRICVGCVWNVMAHAQKPHFVFRRNGLVHLNRRGRQFSRLLAAEVCASAVVMLDTPCSEVMWGVLATHSIRQFPLHFPSRASPCAIRFQTHSTYTQVLRNIETLVGVGQKKKKMGQQWMPRAKKIFPCATLGARAIRLLALA